MSGAYSVAVAIAVVAAIQSLLSIWLDRLRITKESFRKIFLDKTRSYTAFGVEEFFNSNDSDDRVEAVISIAMLSARVTTQLTALVGTLAGSVVLTGFVFASRESLGWKLGTTAFSALALIALVILGNRIRIGALRDFILKRSMGGSIWDTTTPYVAIVFTTAIFIAIAGIFIQ